MNLKEKIRVIEGFPKEGISFKDVTTILQDSEAYKYAIDKIVEKLKDKKVDLVVGPEARGFLFGAPVAYALGVGFIPVRKKGKLPYDTISINYDLEYGSDELEIHKDCNSRRFTSNWRNYILCRKTCRTSRRRSCIYKLCNGVDRFKGKRKIKKI